MARRYPVVAVTGTLASSADFNDMVIETLIYILAFTIGGVNLHALNTAKDIGHDVGDIKQNAGNADLGARWLICDGRTIGSASSGATARANADMITLYTHLWTNFSNTELVIQDSSGTPTTRGASAAADFAANKRLPLLDLRGRVIAGMDDPGTNTAANRVTSVQADVLGGVMGTETHTLTSTEMPSHSHSIGSGDNFWASKGTPGPQYSSSSGSDNMQKIAATNTAGSGGAHQNMQPTLFLNHFIYTGL